MAKKIGVICRVVKVFVTQRALGPVCHLELPFFVLRELRQSDAINLPEICQRELLLRDKVLLELLGVKDCADLDSEVALQPLDVAADSTVEDLHNPCIFKHPLSDLRRELGPYFLIKHIDNKRFYRGFGVIWERRNLEQTAKAVVRPQTILFKVYSNNLHLLQLAGCLLKGGC